MEVKNPAPKVKLTRSQRKLARSLASDPYPGLGTIDEKTGRSRSFTKDEAEALGLTKRWSRRAEMS